MATIQSSIVLNDNLSKTMNSIVAALNKGAAGFKSLSDAADVPAKGIENINDAIEDAISSQEQLNSAVDSMDVSGAGREYDALNSEVQQAGGGIRNNSAEQEKFNDKIRGGESAANKLKSVIASIAGVMSVKAATDWVKGSVDLTNEQIKAEQLLTNVLANQGNTYADLAALKAEAAAIQGKSMYTDQALIGGAAELSTYLKDAEAVKTMMGTLADYAAGMAGGAEVGYREMIDYATQLGKALDGQYDGLTKKGFQLSDAQKEIIANGTDMERALTISDVINQSWAGLAEQMAQTPQGLQTNMNNAINEMRENLGAGLMPAILAIFTMIYDHMPQIERLIMGLIPIITILINVIGGIIDAAFAVYEFFVNNWSWIGPIIMTVAAAFVALKIATLLQAAAQWAANAAMMASPITWIIMGIAALIALIYIGVAAWNDFANESISATGVVAGVFAALGASIYNILATMANNFIIIAEFWVNVWRNPIFTVKKYFADFIINVLDMLISFTAGWDQAATNLYNAMVTAINGVIDVINALIDALNSIPLLDLNIGHVGALQQSISITSDMEGAKAAIKSWVGEMPDNYTELSKIQMIDIKSAFDTGYEFGESVEKNLNDLFSFDELPTPEDFVYTPEGFGEGFDMPDLGGGGDIGGIGNNVGKIAGNTAKMQETSEQELKYMRDIAERDVINRFTVAEINFDMGGVHNTVNNEMDLDGVADYIGDAMMERIAIVAEGDYA